MTDVAALRTIGTTFANATMHFDAADTLITKANDIRKSSPWAKGNIQALHLANADRALTAGLNDVVSGLRQLKHTGPTNVSFSEIDALHDHARSVAGAQVLDGARSLRSWQPFQDLRAETAHVARQAIGEAHVPFR